MYKEKKIKIKVISLLSLLIVVMGISLIGKNFYRGAFAPASKKLPIYAVSTTEKKMSITFDVNWGEDKSKEILDILDKYNVKATFYIIGLWCDDYPEMVKEIYSRGHEIGNHSNKHPDYVNLSKEAILKDVEIANAKIMALTGEIPKTFRFPSGSYNDLAVETVEGMGLKTIQWDVDKIVTKVNKEGWLYNENKHIRRIYSFRK